MTSPFPGMDPYLESPTHWSDFHHQFVTDLSDAINGVLPENYLARIDERVMLITPVLVPPERASYKPDVSVVRDPAAHASRGAAVSAAVAAPFAPEAVTLENMDDVSDPYTEAYLKIVRLPEQELVTVFELFSPTNKYGEGRGQYMQKRRELLRQPVHVVELDLLRAGPRLQFTQPLPRADYFAFVTRVEQRRRSDAYGWTVRDRMPAIPVPLRSPDNDVLLDLQPPFTASYQRGRYWKMIDYTQPPPPPFDADQSEWVMRTGSQSRRPAC